MECKGKCLLIKKNKATPKVTNPNTVNFTSSNRFEPLAFMSNSSDLGSNIDNSEESDLHGDFKRAVKDS